MIRVQTGSRLHFGLLGLDSAGVYWPNRDGELVVPSRSFGGMGLMVEDPTLTVEIQPGRDWSADGPLAQRALRIANHLKLHLECLAPDRNLSAAHIQTKGPAEHVGLGVGTQLALAVSKALITAWELRIDVETLALWVGRGKRSALGVHGFSQGGFLVETGKRDPGEISPLAVRLDFPAEWPILLLIPRSIQGQHGDSEERVFQHLVNAPVPTADLCRLVLLGLVPAIQTKDYRGFAEALYDFNQRAGDAFAPLQGGVYSSPEVSRKVAWLRRQGIPAVGQTSWGPTVFAILPHQEKLGDLQNHLATEFGDQLQIITTKARNQPAIISKTP